VSGDGANNQGAPVEIARDLLVSDGITINGLPIMIKAGDPGGFMSVDNLDVYYKDCVIGGLGAFIHPVRDAREFPHAIRAKIIREIASLSLPAPLIQLAQASATLPTCMAGEAQRERWGN